MIKGKTQSKPRVSIHDMEAPETPLWTANRPSPIPDMYTIGSAVVRLAPGVREVDYLFDNPEIVLRASSDLWGGAQ